MPKYTVHLVTTTRRCQYRSFNADTEEAARHAAESEDWAEWPDEEDQTIETGIDWIEEVAPDLV